MSRTITPLLFAFPLVTASVFTFSTLVARGETVAHWSFDDGMPTNTASSVASAANPSAMSATATNSGTGKVPRFDADIPADRIWSGAVGSAVSSGNGASLRFLNAGLPANINSGYGGCVVAADSALIRLTNLTVEVFAKVAGHVNWPLLAGKSRTDGGGTSWSIDLDNAGKPRVRIDTQPIGASSGSGWNQNWTSSVGIEDGGWHHLAFVYTHSNRAVRLYVDRVLRASGSSYSNLVYDARELRIGQGAGDRAFDGWIDEVRISDCVLSPDQFLTTTEPTATRGYWPFGNGSSGASAGTLTNLFYAPLFNGTAAAVGGGAKPVFSPETPTNTTRRVSAGTDGEIVNIANTTSLRFFNAGLPTLTNATQGSQVTLPGLSTITHIDSFTAEAFVRVDRHVCYPQIIGEARSGGLSWSLGMNASGNLRARFDTQNPPAVTNGFNQTFDSSAKIEDGRWHHVALTYDGSTRRVTLYRDYAKVLEGTAANPLVLDGGDIKIGAGDQAFDGWIDEVRLTAQALAPEHFLRTVPLVGSVTAIQ